MADTKTVESRVNRELDSRWRRGRGRARGAGPPTDGRRLVVLQQSLVAGPVRMSGRYPRAMCLPPQCGACWHVRGGERCGVSAWRSRQSGTHHRMSFIG